MTVKDSMAHHHRRWHFGLSVFFLSWLIAATAWAHEIRPAIVTISFTPQAYEIDISANLEALIAGVSPKHSDTQESPNAKVYDSLRALPPDQFKAHFAQFEKMFLAGVALEVDGQRTAPTVTTLDVPEVGDLSRSRLSRVQLAGALPSDARLLRFAYAAEFGGAIVRFPTADGSFEALWLKDGRRSEPYIIGLGLEKPTRFTVIGQYAALGFTHILPLGLDHILFVLGLFLLSLKLKPLLIQVTAFTVAHTITLALSIYGVVSMSPTIVEPLIAASIVYVAVENILTPRLHAWRPFVVFGFGLLHGLGFAGVLEEVGLPRSEFVTGLLSFNVGVELGQLAVIALAYAAVGHWFKEKSWYRSRVVIPASALVALVGLYWTVERVL